MCTVSVLGQLGAGRYHRIEAVQNALRHAIACASAGSELSVEQANV